ncbi:tetratricopeptide repeat protein [Dyadobacter chenwenxiniae]|uniref:Tetratricopeptide repeat protein n=1 Tax=Dyadobacter chenwenxiniae TaxID=2906456 RepID=A0A9X1PJF7_9BACT|nr:tetratricopeptide repeat protein [Dyadobacter chenwenxiniae]MCF0061475.1 tetratricopeptide repeat protein [Dyadobacter chenwenxiniae]UON81298.1 tetratricopeptide repeat protein [Dyadobacter chenwenxiniae]
MRKVILHLTDLHFGWDGNDVNRLAERKLCLNGLIKAISKLDVDWRPSIVCLSGDIGWKGIESDYIEAKQWLDKLLKIVGIGYDRVLVCSGNHDVERAKTGLLTTPKRLKDAQDLLKIPLSFEMHDVFQNFSMFCQTSGIFPYKVNSEDSTLWGERVVDGIRFVTLNSSWFCKDDNDKENLWIGQKLLNYLEANGQFPEVVGEKDALPTVVMMHHPFEWLNPEETHGFENKLNTKDYIAHRGHLLITGHEHGEARGLDRIAEGMYHSKGGATYSGGEYNNNARIFMFDGDNLVYRSLIYETGSPSREWRVTEPVSLALRTPIAGDEAFISCENSILKSAVIPKELTLIPIDYGEFFGRDEDLSNLTALLERSSKVVLMNGLGGIGKTTLAKRLVNKNRNRFDHIIWIGIAKAGLDSKHDNSINLKQAFLQNLLLFDNLKLPFIVEHETENAKFSRLMNAIKNLDGYNLLVIDNVGNEVDQHAIRAELPNPPSWKVLLTSKRKPSGYDVFELNKITLKASLELFFQSYKSPCSREKVIELLEEVDFHTLTVELLAKTLQAHYGTTSVEDLLTKIRSKQLDDPHFQRKIVTEHSEETEVFENLLAVFNVSNLSQPELQLLRRLTLLPPGIYDINNQLGVAFQRLSPEDLRTFHEAIHSLDVKGWIKVSGQSIEMHKMMHQMISYQEKITWEDAEPFVQFFTVSLNYDFHTVPKDAWGFVPFGEFLVDTLSTTEGLGFQDDIHALKNNLSAIYKDMGRFEDARKFMESSVEEAVNNLPKGHLSILKYKNTLALIYKNLEIFDKAENLSIQVLDETLQNSNESNKALMIFKSNLAVVYKSQGRSHEAIELFESASRDAIDVFGDESAEAALSFGKIATVLQDMQDYSKAAVLLENSLRILQKTLPAEHPHIAVTQSNLSFSYQKLERFEEAIELSKKSLKAAEDYFGTKHHTYITRMKNLGLAYSRSNQKGESLKILFDALALSNRVLGENHSIAHDIQKEINLVQRSRL